MVLKHYYDPTAAFPPDAWIAMTRCGVLKDLEEQPLQAGTFEVPLIRFRPPSLRLDAVKSFRKSFWRYGL